MDTSVATNVTTDVTIDWQKIDDIIALYNADKEALLMIM